MASPEMVCHSCFGLSKIPFTRSTISIVCPSSHSFFSPSLERRLANSLWAISISINLRFVNLCTNIIYKNGGTYLFLSLGMYFVGVTPFSVFSFLPWISYLGHFSVRVPYNYDRATSFGLLLTSDLFRNGAPLFPYNFPPPTIRTTLKTGVRAIF